MVNVYVASSWKNEYHDATVLALRKLPGLDVFDYRKAGPSGGGFSWLELETESHPDMGSWKDWDLATYLEKLRHPRADEAFSADMEGLMFADIVILVMPSGISSHLELGYAVGNGKISFVYYPSRDLAPQIDLMVKMCSHIVVGLSSLLEKVLLATSICRISKINPVEDEDQT